MLPCFFLSDRSCHILFFWILLRKSSGVCDRPKSPMKFSDDNLPRGGMVSDLPHPDGRQNFTVRPGFGKESAPDESGLKNLCATDHRYVVSKKVTGLRCVVRVRGRGLIPERPCGQVDPPGSVYAMGFGRSF